jgi:ABC-2 type transport system ATP-binding protein
MPGGDGKRVVIEAEGLAKHFGAVIAVEEVSLRVEPGAILALLGPNGAGKTTTIRMLSALLTPTLGRARVGGFDTVREAQQVRRSIGLLTEVPGLYQRMNPVDYLTFFAELQGVPKSKWEPRARELLHQFGLWEARRRPIGTFSKGMRQKVALTRALVHDPKVIFLDEPTSAMDPASAKLVRDYILELRRSDRTIVLCTHNLAEAERVADRIAIVNRGRIAALGTSEELKRQLLGAPRYEVRARQSPVASLRSLNGAIRIEDSGPTWAKYTAAVPEDVNPLVLRHLVEDGLEVVSLSEVPRRLEAVYLAIVGEDQAQAPTGGE